jgi:hypothetical protein
MIPSTRKKSQLVNENLAEAKSFLRNHLVKKESPNGPCRSRLSNHPSIDSDIYNKAIRFDRRADEKLFQSTGSVTA